VGAALCLAGVAVIMYAPRPSWAATPPGASVTDHNKATVRRLIEEVLTGGRLEVIDELYAPELAPAAKRWIAPDGSSGSTRSPSFACATAGSCKCGHWRTASAGSSSSV
jgi:hypothetical protein